MLIYILTEFSKEVGHPINTDRDRASAIAKINKAAKELYSSADLVGCMREQVFNVDSSRLQVTLPYYIDELRNARHYDTRARVKIEDMRPRYFYGKDWPQKYLSFRKKNKICTARDLDNDGLLTVTIPQAESSRFTVYITGSTIDSDRITEALVFDIGTITQTTINSFTSSPGFRFIGKDKLTSNNVTISDLNGNVISEIANCEQEAIYTLISVGDLDTNLQCECYELLYKYKFSPFYNDYDTFPAPEYDDAIVYKAASHVWSKDTSDKGQAMVLEYETKCATILTNRVNAGEDSDEKEIQFGRQRFFDIQSYGYPTGFDVDVPTRLF